MNITYSNINYIKNKKRVTKFYITKKNNRVIKRKGKVLIMRGKRHKQKQNRLERVLEIPKEISTNEPKITIMGFNEMLIENYKGILEYQEFYIRISTYIGILNINGFNLNLTEMTSDDILITGKIETIDFEEIEGNIKSVPKGMG